MGYGELVLVILVALLVLRPKELRHCAFWIARMWRMVQSLKSMLSAHLLHMDADGQSAPHDSSHG